MTQPAQTQAEYAIAQAQLQNTIGLSDEALDHLANDLNRFAALDGDLPIALLKYAVDGEDESALQEFTRLLQKAIQRDPRCWHDSPSIESHRITANIARKTFFRLVPTKDVAFYYRLAKIYHTQRNEFPVHFEFIRWPQILLDPFLDAIAFSQEYHPHKYVEGSFPIDVLEAMCVVAGEPAESLAKIIFTVDLSHSFWRNMAAPIIQMAGFIDYIGKYPEALRSALTDKDVARRVFALKTIQKREIPLELVFKQVIDRALSSAKADREAAWPLLESVELACHAIEQRLTTGKADERLHAAQFLHHVNPEKAQPILARVLASEKSEKVRNAIEDLLNPMVIESSTAPTHYELPPLQINLEEPLSDSVWAEIEELLNLTQSQLLSEGAWENRKLEIKETLSNGVISDLQSPPIYKHTQWPIIIRQITRISSNPELRLIQLLRLWRMFNHNDTAYFLSGMSAFVQRYYHAHPDFNLRILGATLEKLGISNGTSKLIKSLLPIDSYVMPTPLLHLGNDAIWPLFSEDLEHLKACLTVKPEYDYYKTDRIQRTLQIINTFPQPPAQLIPTLWNMALSGPQKERLMAQTTLDRLPDSRATILQCLKDSEPQKRIIAAQWLARLQDRSSIPQLIQLLKTEKREIVRDAWMRSLERLGASVDEFLNRDNLIQEATTGLKKGIPTALAWFPCDRLPTLHWEDSNQPVAPEIIQWFLVQTHKQKNVEPSPMLRRYLQAMKKSDREALGHFILETWISQDTQPQYSQAEAETKAQQEAQQSWQQIQQYKQQFPNISYYQNETEEKIYKRLLQSYLTTYDGSATKDKGILAIGACGGASLIPPIGQYLKTHYGQRLAQCLALLQVLAWIEDHSAIQLLLSVSNRFRTKKIQTEAAQLVNQIADRHNWSRDELADRTIPTCGFTEGDTLTLDYGERQFQLKLNDNLNLTLTDSQNKTLKALPDARKDEDPELVKLSQTQFSTAKKQLKQVLTLQQERLYEAMCTQRHWQFRDWETYLAQHPIVSRHCQRLIWLERDAENQVIRSFRALGDGSLTDPQDRALTIVPDARITLAHGSLLSVVDRQAWQTQLDDYEIIPIFDQLSKPIYQLPPDRQKDLELNDFTGHMLEAFHLRGRATKLGYTRGEAQDGGWFYEYHKRFLGLGLIATIEFSGNGLPEENRPIALTQLSFSQILEPQPDQYSYDSRIPLETVPIVLLSEIYEDLRSIAALGSGFDPDWEKKIGY